MSKLGKKPINIPKDTKVKLESGRLVMTGPKGSKELSLNDKIFSTTIVEDNSLVIKLIKKNEAAKTLWGTTRSIINSAIIGVSVGHERTLELNGVGYRATLKGKVLELLLGFSHPINYNIPEDISVSVDKQNNIEIKGPSKQLVGQTAAEIRSFRGPEPYKGKGIKYADEYINRKEGKKK